jgi:tetratricopeptide (TPR) repeat protein
MVRNFTKGSWYRAQTFNPEALDEALRLARQAVELGPGLTEAHAQLARVFIVRGDLAQAAEHLKQARALEDGNFYGWYYEGILAEKERKVREASEWFDKAEQRVSRPFQRGMVLSHRGNLANLEGNVEAEEHYLRQEITDNPSSPHAYGNYGQFLLRHERYREAVEQTQKAVALGPYQVALAQLSRAKGYVAEEQGNVDEAIKWFQDALRYEHERPHSHYKLAKLYHTKKKDPQRARQHYEQAITLDPPHFKDAYIQLGNILWDSTQDYARVLELAKAVIMHHPDYAKAYYQAGRSLQMLGRWQEALDYYRKYIAMEPDGTEAKWLRSQLPQLQ